MTMRAWMDGVLVGHAPALRADDHGFTVGDGVFETCSVRGGEVFALTRHLRRLTTSARGLGLADPDLELVRDGIAEVLDGPPLGFGRLRITVSSGPGPLGSERADVPQTVVVLAAPVARPLASTAVVVSPWVRNERSAVVGLKTTSYAENAVALADARRRGGSEALMANTRDELCEGTGSNVLLALDGELVTPPLESGALAGITRELLLLWADDEGLAITERPVAIADVHLASEVALLSSTRDVQPVHALDGRALLAPGPLTRRAIALFGRRANQGMDP